MGVKNNTDIKNCLGIAHISSFNLSNILANGVYYPSLNAKKTDVKGN